MKCRAEEVADSAILRPARDDGISVNSVSFHLKNIYAKLEVHSKTEAVVKALRERMI